MAKRPPAIPATIRMEDGSVFRWTKTWREAFRLKYGERPEEALREFREATARHWRGRTVPTKFGTTEPWITEDEERSHEYIDAVVYLDRDGPFRNQAELGEKVMYVALRAVLMSMAMASEGRGPKVFAIQGDGGVAVYDGKKKSVFRSMEDAFDEAEGAKGGDTKSRPTSRQRKARKGRPSPNRRGAGRG